jgi:hypothetical protein
MFVTESRPLDRAVVVQLHTEDRTNAGKRASKAKVHDEYCVNSFGPAAAAALRCSGVVSSAAGAAPRSPSEKPCETDDRR